MCPAARRAPFTPSVIVILLVLLTTAAQSESLGESEECSYNGRWYSAGSVTSLAGCVRCACARGVLSCARLVCADPPKLPAACSLRQRPGGCCPEIHCPDGVTSLEDDSAVNDEELLMMAKSADLAHSCRWEGGVFSLGSALGAQCSACYCARGGAACARDACLPPPPHCTPRPAPPECCPTSYHCQHNQTTPSHQQYDCEVNGEWISEGSPVPQSLWAGPACSQCYCLHGAVRCQPQRCAPALRGCTPKTRPGDCCPYQYTCSHTDSATQKDQAVPDYNLIPSRHVDRSIHSNNITNDTASSSNTDSASTTSSTTVIPPKSTATVKVKRKTSGTPSTKYQKTEANTSPKENTQKSTTAIQPDVTTVSVETTQASMKSTTSTTTEQPDGTIKVIVNGTINCTAEISSLNITSNDTKINQQGMPRVPLRPAVVEAQPGDIITERTGGAFDEDSFTINVTSSLLTNSSGPSPSTPTSPPTTPSTAPVLNASKKTTEDYDYDYVEPTLPPSLPNLKIIPFVAADAVIEEAPAKETVSYPIDREDKFPVYYPTVESKRVPYAERREDVYPTQYPVFVSKVEKYESDEKFERNDEVSLDDEDQFGHGDYTQHSAASPRPSSSLEVKPPAVNLFSPPAETEGGFIPKGPGIIDEYYAVYPSTHVPPSLPHLTTSMQLNTVKEDSSDCLTSEGRRVSAGESVDVSCSVCTCSEGRLSCSPRACPRPPPHCVRRPSSSARHDPCCGEVVCRNENKTTTASSLPARGTDHPITLQESKVPIELLSEIIPFDPPPDRREPPTSPRPTSARPTSPHPTTSSPQDDKQKKTEQEYKTTTNAASVNISTAPPLNVTGDNNATRQNTESTSTTPVSISVNPSTEALDADNTNSSQSLEYEDEDEDEGFSFGSVLKLLLSDSYDSTTISPKKPATVLPPTTRITTTTTARPLMTTKRFVPRPSVAPFIPLPHHTYIPPKKVLPQLTANRIDHLVLGEATAIRKTTVRPTTTKVARPNFPNKTNMPTTGSLPNMELKPSKGSVAYSGSLPSKGSVPHSGSVPSKGSVPHSGSVPSKSSISSVSNIASVGVVNRVPSVSSAPSVGSVPTVGNVPSAGHANHVVSVSDVASVSSTPSKGGGGSLGGLLKVAGCNIYGRMYSVGAEIGELTARCQRCRCEDLGVHCTTIC